MVRFVAFVSGALLALTTGACAQPPALSAPPLLIQGALGFETAHLVAGLKDARIEAVGGWTFWRGTVDGYPVVVSRTGMGGSNAAAATALAIERYQPAAILNQGTAGGHDPALDVGDIVLGRYAVSIAAFKTPPRLAGLGSNTLTWAPLDPIARDGDSDGDLHEGQVLRIPGDNLLLTAAKQAAPRWGKARVVEGTIGSSDVWNEERDRIAHLRQAYGTSVEEMETAPAAQIAAAFKVRFLGIRVVTANVTNGGAYDPKTGDACQEFVLQVARAYIAANTR